jgi:ABC-type lipoprotein release transport system permease subunit
MKIIDILGMSLKNLFRRKIRTILTLIGVLIGTTSITVMMSIGIGLDKTNEDFMQGMVDMNVITVESYYFPDIDSGSGFVEAEFQNLNDEAVQKFYQIEGVEAVSPELNMYATIKSGRYEAGVSIVGIDPKVMEAFNYKVEKGRLLSEDDQGAIVFGNSIPYHFYNPRDLERSGGFYIGDRGMSDEEPPVDVLNDKLSMFYNTYYGMEGEGRQRGYNVQGVGILKQNWQNDYNAYMSIEYLKKIKKEDERKQRQMEQSSEMFISPRRNSMQESEYERILVKVKDINDVDEIQEKIKEMGFGAHSYADMRNETKKQMFIIQAILGAIGGISLLVAAIGITNTMYMSIYERTKEIGVIKVLGCFLGDIRKMFLVEAGLIGLLGGLIGMALSYGISIGINYIASTFMGAQDPMMMEQASVSVSIIPLWLALFGIAFAVFVGIIAGYFPSRRAMKISALEAIRTE